MPDQQQPMTELEKKQKAYYERKPSWKEAHKLADEMLAEAKEIQKAAAIVMVKTPKLRDLALKFFNALPKADTNVITYTPLSPDRLMSYLYQYMAKSSGAEFRLFSKVVNGLMTDVHKTPDFADAIKDAIAYGFKLEKQTPDVESIT